MSLDELEVSGMKSHDYYVFLQTFLLVMIQELLKEDVGGAVTELCLFFKELCSRTLKMSLLESMLEDIEIFFCRLEMIFPDTFFTVMMTIW